MCLGVLSDQAIDRLLDHLVGNLGKLLFRNELRVPPDLDGDRFWNLLRTHHRLGEFVEPLGANNDGR